MKSKERIFQIAEEIAFVKVLASNDLSLRNRAIKKLHRWIAAKSQNPNTAFTDDDFIRLWEGLFFSMWMSDKPLIQVSILVSTFPIGSIDVSSHGIVLFA
ncbi:ribosomal RNA processing protein 1 homolog A [Diaphorina citri]|uniref:Ribosomal RNA processing protein 1 homolog A n=1 Tax=Diaphorina citri TaxID=121845 RepID=A0A3Q0IPW7_DIACI|nr:ribosomal RNA processing protein 1 homolog A [Diaphorina citri]